jgi:hypothetical protein
MTVVLYQSANTMTESPLSTSRLSLLIYRQELFVSSDIHPKYVVPENIKFYLGKALSMTWMVETVNLFIRRQQKNCLISLSEKKTFLFFQVPDYESLFFPDLSWYFI